MPPSPVTSNTPPPHLYFNVPPEPSHLLRARERLRDYLRQYCTEQRVIDDLVLCVEEACTNAIRHSGSDADITISLAFDDGLLAATVKDQGAAFDVARFDPAATPDPTVDHGRGLYIIAALMDSLRLVVDGGLEVHMARRAVPSCAPAALESGIGGQAGNAGHRDARFSHSRKRAFHRRATGVAVRPVRGDARAARAGRDGAGRRRSGASVGAIRPRTRQQ